MSAILRLAVSPNASARYCQFFWTTLQAHSDSVCSSWDKNGPIPEVTGFLGSWHGRRPTSLRSVCPQSASGGTRRDEPEFGVGRVTGISYVFTAEARRNRPLIRQSTLDQQTE